MMYTSPPIEIGPGIVPGAIQVLNTRRAIAEAIGRKGLLGHRGASLVAIAAADLARTHIYRGDTATASASGVVTVAPNASRDAVLEVSSLAREGRYRSISILDAPNVSPNVASASASIRLGARGPAFTVDAGRAGVATAWRSVAAMLAAGRCPLVLLIEILDDPALEDEQPSAVATVVSAAPCTMTPVVVADDPFDLPAGAATGHSLGGSRLAVLWADPVLPPGTAVELAS
jgi:hypothetical protein